VHFFKKENNMKNLKDLLKALGVSTIEKAVIKVERLKGILNDQQWDPEAYNLEILRLRNEYQAKELIRKQKAKGCTVCNERGQHYVAVMGGELWSCEACQGVCELLS
jgi:hypothetical protein